MKYKDKQVGRPHVLYKDTKSNIEALSGIEAGAAAYATDTNELGIYGGTQWYWYQGNMIYGDMLKAIYDTNNDGIVDSAASVPWSGVTGKPGTYPPDAHNHSADDINSGVLDAARIPNLDASKITSGTLSTDRFSAYTDLQAEGKIGMYGTNLPTASQMRLNANPIYDITEDFTTTTPTGWSWAGSPFVTPATIQTINSTWLRLAGMTSGQRSFFYKTSVANQVVFAIMPALDTTTNGMHIGIRFDDGTDNNYSEVVLQYSSSGTPFRVYYRHRIGGGTVTETELTNLAQPMFDGWLIHAASGTRWSSWYSYAIVTSRNGTYLRGNQNGATMTFTPTRVGIVIKFGGLSWQSALVDAVNF